MTERYTVTSALPYIHGVPHLGNIAGSLLPADIFHRYLDVRGKENVYICGSDVHGTPLKLEALERGIPVEELKEKNHRKIKEILEDFEIDFSIYSDTDSDFNRKQTHEMFEEIYCSGYMSEKAQELAYCRNDERFLPDRYIEGECPHCGGLARGDQCDDCGKLVETEEIINPECQICGKQDIEFRETTNLFIDLPEFKEDLKEWLETGKSPIPENKLKEVRNAIDGTEPRCITRDIEWGFEVPVERVNKRIDEENLDVPELDPETYQDKVLYVWFDAPIGYIGFTRELMKENWEKWWKDEKTDVYYSLGKDNTIFHTVIWPSMLIGASEEDSEYNLPEYEFIHEFIMAEDTKFSKSRGKGLGTEDALDMLPADYWRYYISSVLPIGHDTKFSWDDLEARINNELNDTIGNYVNRVLSLAENWFSGKAPEKDLESLDQESEEFLEEIRELVGSYIETIEEEKNLRRGLKQATSIARRGDEFLSEREPWNNENIQEDVILACLQTLKPLAAALYPYIPVSSRKIWKMIGEENSIDSGKDVLEKFMDGKTAVEPGRDLGEREILFDKIDSDKLKEQLDELEEKGDEDMEDTVSFEQFGKMDLRTATVKEVQEHPNADKLYVVKLDTGDGVKQTCAGLKNFFEPEELEGKQVVILNNLETAELRGKKSECMMLAVESGDEVRMIQPEERVENGLEIH